MASICRRAGIRSTGYFSDLLKGKKAVGRQYLKTLGEALSLHGLEAEFLDLLILKEAGSADEEGTEARLEEIRKVFRLSLEASIPAATPNFYFCLLVLSSLSILGAPASREQVIGLMGRERFVEVDRALAFLVANGYISRHGHGFILEKSRVIFGKSEDGASHIDFLKQALTDALGNLDAHYEARDRAFFLSTFVSVERSRYKEQLLNLKRSILKLLTDMESNEPDDIVKFNVQLFPFRPEDQKDAPR